MTKTMIEKLSEHYVWCMKHGNGGHAVGFYSETEERIRSEYEFPSGKFTLKKKEERFFLWNYDLRPRPDQRYI